MSALARIRASAGAQEPLRTGRVGQAGVSRISLETIFALLLTLIAIAEHLVNRANAGGLWRDEANLAALGAMSSWREWWHLSPFESAAPLCSLSLRLVLIGGIPLSDGTLRTIGLLIGLGVLAMSWRIARAIGGSTPLVTIAFLGLGPSMVRYGDSIRPYGIGSLAALATFAAFHAFVEQPTARRWLLALAASLVAVHTLFGNAVLVLAICLGAVAGARDARTRILVLAAGATCAASLAIERPIFAVVAEYVATIGGFSDFPRTGRMADAAVEGHGPLLAALATGTAGLAIARVVPRRDPTSAGERSDRPPVDRTTHFAFVTLVACVVGYATFLRVSGFAAFTWHVLPPLCLAVVMIDVLRGRAMRAVDDRAGGAPLSRAATALLVVTIVACSCVASATVRDFRNWDRLRERSTNADLLAARLRRDADADDLIVVAPWERGMSFDRYYDGVAPWTTIPPLADVRVHRMDLIIDLLRTLEAEPTPDSMTASMRELTARVAATVRGGHRVWWVGEDVAASPPQALPRPSQAAQPWQQGMYRANWAGAVKQAVLDAGGRWSDVRVDGNDGVNRFENGPLRCGSLPGVTRPAAEFRQAISWR